jgi:hypothetical protein
MDQPYVAVVLLSVHLCIVMAVQGELRFEMVRGGKAFVLASARHPDLRPYVLNDIEVVTRGDNFTFYVNQQQVMTARDRTYSVGAAGVYIGTHAAFDYFAYIVAITNDQGAQNFCGGPNLPATVGVACNVMCPVSYSCGS